MSDLFVQEIKEILQKARSKAYKATSNAMVEAYWLMGQRIVVEEQDGNAKATYGKAILKNLSKALQAELGDGFSYANLRNFRQFYLTYPNFEKCYTLCSKLSWSHNRLIMRVDNEQARNYYLEESAKSGWSVRELERQINTATFERLLSTNQPVIATKTDDTEKYNFIKDPYVFEFLKIPQNTNTSESDLEQLLIDNLQKFLLELGKGFAFVGRQYRISTETSHFYIDLVFYNYLLKCFVLFDLKITKLKHQDIGQMDMYVRMFDDLKKQETDNPTIGIILCADKEETVVKYSVLNEHQQLFASKYLSYLPTEEELKNEVEYIRQLRDKEE